MAPVCDHHREEPTTLAETVLALRNAPLVMEIKAGEAG